MKNSSKRTEQFIRQRMMEDADAYEKQLNADASLEYVKATPQMKREIMEKVAVRDTSLAALSEEDRQALEMGRRVLSRRKRTRAVCLAGLAAVVLLAGTFGISMTSEANRLRLLNAWYALTGQEVILSVNNGDDIAKSSALIQQARAEIEEKTGIRVMQFMYLPQGMEFESYTVEEASGEAKLFYTYKDTLLCAEAKKSSDIAVQGTMLDGKELDSFLVDTAYGEVLVRKIEMPGDEWEYMADFTYNECRYMLYGVLSENEFVEIIENMIF
ncbi:MAG: DUF4367 domain-containing protein [Eubacteriales bacterium]|nr:DUF4367 domain-containing protein [Eubacteriales bacterium]